MSITDYLLDSALVLLVLLQIKERPLTTHSITSAQAWTDALLAMAVFEVLGRSALLYLRRNKARAEVPSAAELA